MGKCDNCETEVINCNTCEDFDVYVNSISDIQKLKKIRKILIFQKPQNDASFNGKIADMLVAKVGTMGCFYAFIVLATIPLISQNLMQFVSYLSSGYLQLVLLPLIMVASNRTDAIREQRNEREWKISLVNAAIEELLEDESLAFEKNALVSSLPNTK